MRLKALFIILATVFVVWTAWIGLLDVRYEKNRASKGRVIVKIDKNSKAALTVTRFFRDIEKTAQPLLVESGGVALVSRCKEEPVLFGGLFIFFGVSFCGIGFIIHMIRTDSRLI
jgi:hypothetical protein